MVCPSYLIQCSINSGAAADSREHQKISKYKNLTNDYHFVPIGIETFGCWVAEDHKIIKSIGKKIMEVTSEERLTSFLFQQISIAIQHGNSSCVLGTV